MAIPLGKPVDEITQGFESVKIDGHVKASEKGGNAEVRDGSSLYTADGPNPPAPQECHDNPRSPAARMGYPICGDQCLKFPGMESAESLSCPYFDMPVYTGFTAPFHEYPPSSSDGAIYHTPVLEYNPVYNQNLYCSAPCMVGQFNYGYGETYVYPQYQVAPLEQYHVATPLPHNDGTLMPEGSYVPYGSQQMVQGQLAPIAVTGLPPAYNSVAGFHMIPYSPVCTPHALNVASPVWVQQQPVNGKGPNEEHNHVRSKSVFQQPNILIDGIVNTTKPGSEKRDSRVQHLADAQKHGRKQFGPGPAYGVPAPIKGVSVQAGSTMPLGGKNKGPGTHSLNVEQLNLGHFSTDFEDAKHFIIKSFSDENVYRSIQHGVWASTPHGNKKLDEAYEDAQRRAAGKTKGCPVFLYFSVNGSGRFCGVAEMTGRVDFNNTMDFWERNRWCGSFPVKWHFVKDVPHCQLRRIVLQNNENKPVTSSRDTQEVNFEQGLQMLNIIKSYATTASILDNFLNLRGSPKVVEPDVKVEQHSHEISANSRVALEPSVSVVLESSNALKACNGEAKARDNFPQVKSNHGKGETLVQDLTGDKENARVQDSI